MYPEFITDTLSQDVLFLIKSEFKVDLHNLKEQTNQLRILAKAKFLAGEGLVLEG